MTRIADTWRDGCLCPNLLKWQLHITNARPFSACVSGDGFRKYWFWLTVSLNWHWEIMCSAISSENDSSYHDYRRDSKQMRLFKRKEDQIKWWISLRERKIKVPPRTDKLNLPTWPRDSEIEPYNYLRVCIAGKRMLLYLHQPFSPVKVRLVTLL